MVYSVVPKRRTPWVEICAPWISAGFRPGTALYAYAAVPDAGFTGFPQEHVDVCIETVGRLPETVCLLDMITGDEGEVVPLAEDFSRPSQMFPLNRIGHE